MRLILAILLTAALGFVLGLFLPWWSIAIAAFLPALLLIRFPGRGFIAGFTGIFILWVVLALWIDSKNDSLLSSKIASIIPLGGSSILLVLVTGIIGAIVGGFAAMAGSSIRPPK